ncbi:MAG: biotin--[acetyl-CoA-carboxylase] ligase [Bacteroidales bacterium]|jgi:BirA family biotin operon repressor/biotin-[acetyl-CoA-carboxylase] ligase|nr:biotin--[acetyl-CoA-carboxylase] ligase [Bacteroidales bacterium]
MKIIRLQEVDSTSRHLIRLSGDRLEEGTVVVADRQTDGRGQGNNRWESEPGKNLTFSILLYPVFVKGVEQFGLSKAIALAVSDFTAQHAENVSVKWPNDVYLADKKLAGMLVENFMQGERITKTVAGIGVNINQERFSGEAPNPVSLCRATGRRFDTEDCLRQILQYIARRYEQLRTSPDELHSDYIRRLYRFNRWASYQADGLRFKARITGVNRYGMLEMITADNRTKTFGFKEVVFEQDDSMPENPCDSL